jgi:uncharacterized membrane protein YeaQ/YmgE (transglycosylase-associated protein family)
MEHQHLIMVLAAGTLAGRVVQVRGLGCLGNTAVGLAGAQLGGAIAERLLPQGWLGSTRSAIVTFVGACLVLAVLRQAAGDRRPGQSVGTLDDDPPLQPWSASPQGGQQHMSRLLLIPGRDRQRHSATDAPSSEHTKSALCGAAIYAKEDLRDPWTWSAPPPSTSSRTPRSRS